MIIIPGIGSYKFAYIIRQVGLQPIQNINCLGSKHINRTKLILKLIKYNIKYTIKTYEKFRIKLLIYTRALRGFKHMHGLALHGQNHNKTQRRLYRLRLPTKHDLIILN